MTDPTNAAEQGGGAEDSAPPPLGGQIPHHPAPDPATAARAYAESGGAPGAVQTESRPTGDDPAQGAVPADAEAHEDELPVGHEATREELLQRLEQAEAALAIVEAERDEYLADLQRKAAELSNVLKREERNAGAGRVEGRLDVMRALLEVLDDFERTMAAVAASENASLRDGVAMVHDKLRAALAQQGLTRTGEVGETFDPNRHEAVQQVEADDGPHEDPVVAEVFRPGYVVGDRVVRAAMVVVKQ